MNNGGYRLLLVTRILVPGWLPVTTCDQIRRLTPVTPCQQI